MTILCYHTFDADWPAPLAVEPELFARQIDWLVANRRVLDVIDAANAADRRGRLPRGTVALTFDDGLDGVRRHAFPLLVKHRLPATVFLVAQTLSEGRPVDWVDVPPPRPVRALTVDEVMEMREAGVRFGSHSFAHRDLTTLSEDECLRDLRDSRDVLESILGEPVTTIAYPRGRNNEVVRRAARGAGFTHGFSLPEGPEPADRLAIPRIGVYRGNDERTLRLKASAWYPMVRHGRAYATLRRLRGGRLRGESPASN